METLEIIITIVGGTNAALIGFLLNQVFVLRKEVAEQITKEKFESILAHRRLNVHDAVASDLCEEKFDSRMVQDGKRPFPKLNEKLKEIIAQR